MNPSFPGGLDGALWEIGRRWCFASNPNCNDCPMCKDCAKLLVEGEGKLTPMLETNYAKEDDLQALLANYPDLLPGDQINLENPHRLLLVAREVRVPGSEEYNGRWTPDHLYLDQDGMPTFIGCKRASDTRSRREVGVQMLDYYNTHGHKLRFPPFEKAQFVTECGITIIKQEQDAAVCVPGQSVPYRVGDVAGECENDCRHRGKPARPTSGAANTCPLRFL
jgi:hypothetical protein